MLTKPNCSWLWQDDAHPPPKGHYVADAILNRALSSLTGVEAAVTPTFHQPSETESEAMAAINEARAKLESARRLLLQPASKATHRR